MTQKTLFKKAITLDSKEARLLFITNWLEDINWHTENRLFCERNIDDSTQKFLDDMRWLFIALNPNDYSDGFVQDHREELEPYIKAVISSKTHNRGAVTLPCGRTISESTLWDFKQAQKSFSVFSRLTGYGLTTKDWNHTSGIEFVQELEEILASFEESDREREEVHNAYLRAYAD